MNTDVLVVSPLLPFISEAYNVSSAMTGWMVTVFAVTYAIVAPFFAWVCRIYIIQARLTVEYPKERGIVMTWNNAALYIGITIDSMIGRYGYVISNWGYPFLPYVCSIAAIISFAQYPKRPRHKKESAFPLPLTT